MSEIENLEPQPPVSSTIIKLPEQRDRIKLLTAEIKKRLPKCEDKAESAHELSQLAIAGAIRIGWLFRDVLDQIKAGRRNRGQSTTFEDWFNVNFAGRDIEWAKRIMRVSADFQVDHEHAALREKFGLEPLLIEAISEDSLEKQLVSAAQRPSYTGLQRSVGLLPPKAPAAPKEREQKSEAEKVLTLLARAKARYELFLVNNPAEKWDADFARGIMTMLKSFSQKYYGLSVERPDVILPDEEDAEFEVAEEPELNGAELEPSAQDPNPDED
jgi:hypothetical protein